MKKKRGIIIGLCAAICCASISIGSISAKAASKVCRHTAGMYTTGNVVSSWSGNCDVEGLGCTFFHWVEEIHYVCKACNKEIGKQSIHHENHTVCGRNY